LENGGADAVAYGRLFNFNPDLPHRFALGAPLNKFHPESFYPRSLDIGFTDNPFFKARSAYDDAP
jgi:2,4-dienoyl-CoA reductase-like NADH-dependent reductase (Old Yellow Enzyme family)